MKNTVAVPIMSKSEDKIGKYSKSKLNHWFLKLLMSLKALRVQAWKEIIGDWDRRKGGVMVAMTICVEL